MNRRISATAVVLWRWLRSPREARKFWVYAWPGYWKWLSRFDRWRLWISNARIELEGHGTQAGRDAALFAHHLRTLVTGAVVSAVAIAACEAAAAALNHLLHWGTIFETVDPDSYLGFVAAAVGAEAAFLALFFTTVGVIASTSYARVPAEIRSLFVRERTSLIYVRTVTMALLVGIVLLTLPILSHRRPHGLTVCLFAVVTSISVLSLATLGTQLFSFFDLSTLSQPLRRRFRRAVQAATAASGRIPQAVEQSAAHEQTAEILRIYGQLSQLIATRDVVEGRAPEKIAMELLVCWRYLADLKPAIPTRSEWFSQTATHPNWLTLDPMRLNIAVATRTGADPSLDRDPLWAETAIASCLKLLLQSLLSSSEWGRALRVIDRSADLVRYLSARLQTNEAWLLLRTTVEPLENASVGQPGLSAGASVSVAALREPSPSAIAQRRTLAYTQLWLGLTSAITAFDAEQFSTAIVRATATCEGPYRVGATGKLLELLEGVAAGIDHERRAEDQQITPTWWIQHMAARILLQTTLDAIRYFIREAEVSLVDPLISEQSELAEPLAIRILDALELVRKIDMQLGRARHSVEALSAMRHAVSMDEPWPDTQFPDGVAPRLEDELFVKLAEVAPKLSAGPHDGRSADLFGQSYKFLFDATFHSILGGRTLQAWRLFPIVIEMADSARVRLSRDLGALTGLDWVRFGTEPLLDMLELSGLALLMSELGRTDMWVSVHRYWDATLSPSLVGQMLAALSIRARSPGGVARVGRLREVADTLIAHGIVRPRDGGRAMPSDIGSAILDAYAPSDTGYLPYDLADLFVAEYLMPADAASDQQVPSDIVSLHDFIANRRERQTQQSTEDNEPEYP